MDLKSIQTEIDASYLYGKLAEVENDKNAKHVLEQMSEIEMGHAMAFAKKLNLKKEDLPDPSKRAKTLNLIGKIFGYNYVMGVLMETEKSISNGVLLSKKKHKIPVTGSETNHETILRNLIEHEPSLRGESIMKFERNHGKIGGNALRAAVLGGNDGLVSNFGLVMGVAGANADQKTVVLAGVAGLLAGALSMALGEWISVKSSQELYENQMAVEMEELINDPEGEEKELALIYMAKGIPENHARDAAKKVIQNREHAHEIMVKEELGINVEDLKGSAMEAALASFFLFAIGAIIPVIPFFFSMGYPAIFWSAGVSALGLFLIGAAITLFTGRNMWFSGFRQMLFGLVTATITFGIGRLLGVSLS